MLMGILLCVLAALLPAVMLYFPNLGEITFTEMLPYFGIMAGIGVLAWAVMYLIFRKKGLAALTAAACLLVFLNVGRIVTALKPVYPVIGYSVMLPCTFGFLALLTFGFSRLSEDFRRDAVRVAALALAAFILATAVPALIRGPQEDGEEEDPAAETEAAAALEIDLTPAEGTDRPNIWWIVPDEYAGFDELNKYYHYDNTPFYNALREMGFTVSEHSHNWYPDTYITLRDILSLRYTTSSGGKPGRKKMVADPNLPMWTLLRELGYEICEAETTSKFHLVNRLKDAAEDDAARDSFGNTVANLLLQYSIFYRFEDEVLQIFAPQYAKSALRGMTLKVLEWAEDPESVKSSDPCFTVVYFKCPHAPFVFDREGNEVPYEYQKDYKNKKYYLDQLIYLSGRLQKVCENIVANDPDAIIVLQSDHGHRFVDNITWLDMTNVLNAVYFRGKPLEGITDRNALNTWLTVLREQFYLELPEAEEKRMKNKYRTQTRDPKAEDPNEGLID